MCRNALSAEAAASGTCVRAFFSLWLRVLVSWWFFCFSGHKGTKTRRSLLHHLLARELSSTGFACTPLLLESVSYARFTEEWARPAVCRPWSVACGPPSTVHRPPSVVTPASPAFGRGCGRRIAPAASGRCGRGRRREAHPGRASRGIRAGGCNGDVPAGR